MSWYNSSKDAEKLSLTVKGFFSAGVLTAIILVLKALGINLELSDLEDLLDSVTGVIVAIGGLGSAIMILYGAVRRIYLKIIKK